MLQSTPTGAPRAAGARPTAAPPAGEPARAGTNRLLATLRPDDVAALAPHLERVPLAIGEVVAAADAPFRHAFFPETAVLSVVAVLPDGGAVEVGTVGREGLVGLAVVLGGDTSPNATLCQIPGLALRIAAERLVEAVDARAGLRDLLNRYTLAYLTQVAQTAACNRLHELEARCARWLLETHDRVGATASPFPLRQEFLAVMLGVRRAGVTAAAGHLQDAELIRYRRGSIQVLDRAGLEAASCACYGIVRRAYERLLP